MASNDPFTQLAFYMKKQKVAPVSRNTRPHSPNVKAENTSHPKSLNYIENHRKPKQKRRAENWQDLMDKTEDVPKPVPKSVHRHRDTQTKNRIFCQPGNVGSVRSELDSTKSKKPQREGKQMERSVSAKSYNFTRGEPDRDEVNTKRVEMKKARLVNDYGQYQHYWNKETGTVYDELKNGLNDKNLTNISGYKANDYEDPKVTKMKQIMNQHKELLKATEHDRKVIGGSEKTSQKIRPMSPMKYKNDFQSKIDIFGREASANSRKSITANQSRKGRPCDYSSKPDLNGTPSTKTIEITPTRKTLLEEFKAKKMVKN